MRLDFACDSARGRPPQAWGRALEYGRVPFDRGVFGRDHASDWVSAKRATGSTSEACAGSIPAGGTALRLSEERRLQRFSDAASAGSSARNSALPQSPGAMTRAVPLAPPQVRVWVRTRRPSVTGEVERAWPDPQEGCACEALRPFSTRRREHLTSRRSAVRSRHRP